jgi:hypothetical protein
LADHPVIRCAACLAVVPVPLFAGDAWDDASWGCDEPSLDHERSDAETGIAALLAATETMPEQHAPGVVAFVERRRPGRLKVAYIACRVCGGDIELDPGKIRLVWTHALSQCPDCRAEVRLRRSDAYRDVDTGLPWAFASYSNDDLEPQEPPARQGRLFRLWQ